IRQLLTEHVLLAALGGAAGLVLANIGVDLVKTFGPADVPRLADARVDATVLLFSIGCALVSGLLCGAAPAFAAARTDLVTSLKSSGTGTVGQTTGSRTRAALLVAEVALALMLVIASGLLVRTFVSLAGSDAGFDRSRALTFELTLPPATYDRVERIVAV